MTDTITYLPVSTLRESPFNPRKHYPEGSLMDLAESIKGQGVLQPIVVRPLPEGHDDGDAVRYEIVFGHRRYRAARALPEYADDTLRMPCILREMDDQHAALAQVAENLQRRDVTALEEADSLVHLATVHHMPADRIAEQIGKSRSYVYGRLKLAAAAPAVREAVDAKGLAPEIALEVARIRHHKLQAVMLQTLKLCVTSDGETLWPSFRNAKDIVRRQFSNTIGIACFDTGPCQACPHRAGNDPDLHGVLSADVCTDRQCWDAKTAEHTEKRVAELRAQGVTVVDGQRAKEMWPYTWNLPCHTLAHEISFKKPEGGDVNLAAALADLKEAGVTPPEPIYVISPHDGTLAMVYDDDDVPTLQEAWEKVRGYDQAADGASTPSTAGAGAQSGRSGHPGNVEAERAAVLDTWSPAERAVADNARYRGLLVPRMVANVASTPRTVDELRMVIRYDWLMSGEVRNMATAALGLDAEANSTRDALESKDGWDEVAWFSARLDTLSADEVGALMVGMFVENVGREGYIYVHRDGAREAAAARVALAERYGVDVLATAASDDAAGSPDGTAH